MERMNDLHEWLNDLAGKHPVDWELLPDIGLYMDQVQTFIERQLRQYQNDTHERLLTPAMINNYIKDGLIPRAEAKKYNPAHLALLIMIGTLKQVLSIQNLKDLLSECRNPDDIAALYHHFLSVQHLALQENAAQVLAETGKLQRAQELAHAAAAESDAHETPDEGAVDENLPDQSREQTEALRSLALELAIEARVRILIAERVLAMLEKTAPAEHKDKPDRKKRGA